jgi:hypothetical protein
MVTLLYINDDPKWRKHRQSSEKENRKYEYKFAQ